MQHTPIRVHTQTQPDSLHFLPSDERLSAEQVRLLYTQGRSALLASIAASLLIIAILWDRAELSSLLAWGIGLNAATLIRLGLIMAFNRLNPPDCALEPWRIANVAGAIVGGFLWALVVLLLNPAWPASHLIMVYVLLTSIMASAIPTNTIVYSAYLGFMLPITVGMATWPLIYNAESYQVLAPFTLLANGIIVAIAHTYHQTIARILTLKLQNKDLVEHLTETQERTQATLHCIGDAVITTDAAGRIESMNPKAEELAGIMLTAARHQPLNAIFHITDGNAKPIPTLAPLNLTKAQAPASAHDVVLHRQDHKVPVRYSMAPIHLPDGQALGAVVTFQDMSEPQALAQQLVYYATHDPLTGLINRREFENRLAYALKVAVEEDKEHVCLYMDLDQFKIVNDTCGHVAGDELLRQLTAVLKLKLRGADTLARLGGDEFGVLLEGCNPTEGEKIASLLRKTVGEFRFVWDQKTFEIGASIGLVSINRHSQNIAHVLSKADIACYAAKDLGRNRVHIYQDSDTELLRREGEMQWVSEITGALKEGRLALYYQDIMALAGVEDRRRIELLIRMRTPSGRLVLPGAFLPAAERYGLMPVIDRWVIRHTLAWLAGQGADNLQCLINVSGISICDQDFLDFVLKQFKTYKLLPHQICFELTETAAVANLAQALHFMDKLKALGCRFALDDFGSGVSSFAYLKSLPVDYLKIDGGFVRDMLHDPVAHAIVVAITEVSHALGIHTIGEHVESDDILQDLWRLGIHYAQGNTIAEPQPLADFAGAQSGIGQRLNTALLQRPILKVAAGFSSGS